MRKSKDLFNAGNLICHHFLKVTRINLTKNTFNEIKVDGTTVCSDGNLSFSSWVDKMISENYIFLEDQELYKEKMNLSALRKYFKTNDYYTFRYRQLVQNEYHFICLQIIKGKEYRGNSEFVYLYLNDIHDIQLKEQDLINQLKKVTIQAENANRSKSDFLSRMSHDIRNPLNVITGLSTLCQQNLDNKDLLSSYLDKIQNSTAYLLTLINDTLEVSKIESRKLYLKYSNFDFNDMIFDIIDSLNTTNSDTLVHFDSKIIHSNILADRVRLQQIIINIVSNSFKYSIGDYKNIVIMLSEEAIDEDTSLYTLQVKDNGIGMSPEVLSKLFVPYERGIDSRINKIQGTGLGLVIVKSLVELMNGTVDVESIEGIGTTFIIRVPLKHSSDCVTEDKKVLNKDLLKNKKVLIAEDYPINQMILEEFLKAADVKCTFANNGEEAIELYKKEKFDAILMDIQMPNMDGYEATCKIREQDTNIPIIAISADAFNEDVAKMVECGMNDHVSKPIEQNKLLSVLTKYV